MTVEEKIDTKFALLLELLQKIKAKKLGEEPTQVENHVVLIFTGVKGGDFRQWLSQMEDFFVQEDFNDLEKLNMAHAVLEGEALVWYQHRQSLIAFHSWNELREALLLMFGDKDDLERIRLKIENKRILQEFMDSMKQHESSSLETEVIHDDESMPEMISEEYSSASAENESKLVEESSAASMVTETIHEEESTQEAPSESSA